MALYLGISNNGALISSDGYRLQDSNGLLLTTLQENNKWKIIIDNVAYRININSSLKDGE